MYRYDAKDVSLCTKSQLQGEGEKGQYSQPVVGQTTPHSAESSARLARKPDAIIIRTMFQHALSPGHYLPDQWDTASPHTVMARSFVRTRQDPQILCVPLHPEG